MRSTVRRIILIMAGILACGLATAASQVPRKSSQQAAKPKAPTIQAPEKEAQKANSQQKVEASIASAGANYESGGRRDPFLSPVAPKKKTENLDEEVPRGQQPPGIGGMYIAQVKLLGIVSSDSTPTAVLQGIDKRAYFLQEKDKLFDGYIKKIEPDSVILIRETKLRSGKVMTQELTKRLRTP